MNFLAWILGSLLAMTLFITVCGILFIWIKSDTARFLIIILGAILLIPLIIGCHAWLSDLGKKDDTEYHSSDSKPSNNSNSYANGSEWENYDYDNDGDINQYEWEDALGDKMKEYGY